MTFLDRLAISFTALYALILLFGPRAQAQGRPTGDVILETPYYQAVFAPTAPLRLDPASGEPLYSGKAAEIAQQLANHTGPKLNRLLAIVNGVPEWKAALERAKIFPIRVTFAESVDAESIQAFAAFVKERPFIYMPGTWNTMKAFDAILLHETAHVLLGALYKFPVPYHEFIADFLAVIAYENGTYFAQGVEIPGDDAKANLIRLTDKLQRKRGIVSAEATYSIQCASTHYGRDFSKKFPFYLAYATPDSHIISCAINSALFEIGRIMGFDTTIQAVLNVIREDPAFVISSDVNVFMNRVLDNFASWAPVTYGPRQKTVKTALADLGWGPTWDAELQAEVIADFIALPSLKSGIREFTRAHTYYLDFESQKALREQVFNADRPFADVTFWSKGRAVGSTKIRLDSGVLFALVVTSCEQKPMEAIFEVKDPLKIGITFLNKHKKLEKLDVRVKGQALPPGCYRIRT
ncbi:MAG TPA: hypothetical protein VFV50_06010 [Bdellovibrionales bacterium]|nr:hypothetical protein [Bdellovibrionales bacterium]